jgi:GNAT superfamily N-acetyltransferase
MRLVSRPGWSASVPGVEGVTIRRIRLQDWATLRDLRIRSLRNAPEAFGQTVEEAVGQPQAEWVHLARQASAGDRRTWLMALSDGQPIGVVQGRRRPPSDLMVFSMWVDPGYRRRGVGRGLIEAVIAWACEWGSAKAVLWVFAANEPAIRFYQRLGFSSESGTDDAAAGERYGAVAMSRSI